MPLFISWRLLFINATIDVQLSQGKRIQGTESIHPKKFKCLLPMTAPDIFKCCKYCGNPAEHQDGFKEVTKEKKFLELSRKTWLNDSALNKQA
ncbi:uncharacterized protein LOC141865519 isoform X2 [Acropora palmata]|uniref:uncharacterized protein LOC141865519 isoform X2 n=1 Tax=Acropora palmata TaxID=6131 RepID=UPI003DA03D55